MAERVIFSLGADVAGGITRHRPGYVGGSGIEGFRIAPINSNAIAHDRNCSNNLIRCCCYFYSGRRHSALFLCVYEESGELAALLRRGSSQMICFASRLIDDLFPFCFFDFFAAQGSGASATAEILFTEYELNYSSAHSHVSSARNHYLHTVEFLKAKRFERIKFFCFHYFFFLNVDLC